MFKEYKRIHKQNIKHFNLSKLTPNGPGNKSQTKRPGKNNKPADRLPIKKRRDRIPLKSIIPSRQIPL